MNAITSSSMVSLPLAFHLLLGIYKSDYIDELSRIYGDGTSDCMVTPELPLWCSESDDRIEDNNDGKTLEKQALIINISAVQVDYFMLFLINSEV